MQDKNVKEEILTRVYEFLFSSNDAHDPAALRNVTEQIIEELENRLKREFSSEEKENIFKTVEDEVFGLGPLEQLLRDEDISEIMINGPGKVYIEREGKKVLSDIRFRDENHLRNIIEKLLSSSRRRVDELNPYVDVSLPGGARVNIVIQPVSPRGAVVTIRKFLKSLNKIEDLIEEGTLNERMAQFLINCVKAKVNILFSGATGSGKTTTLNILSQYIPSSERIVTIEDTLELRLKQEHVVSLETRQTNIEGKGRISIRDLFVNSLRMRPDRIILGEIRHEEALDLLQAIASGHTGSLAVIHGSSALDAISRLEIMVLTSGINLPVWALRKLIANSINLIVQHEQLPDGSRKIVNITEVAGMENEEIILQDIFYFDFQQLDNDGNVIGQFRCSGIVPMFLERFKKYGIEAREDFFKKDEEI